MLKLEENIIKSSLINELSESFLRYSLSVITDRALPDIKDGLKPVHRRILFSMSELGLTYNKPYKKSALVVGETLGKLHAHGDTSVYDAMVRLAQDFSMRYPLVDGQGNFGSRDGDAAAHYRYTEARLSKISSEMLRELDKNTVPMKLNFSEDLYEPIVLPSRFPNLIVNGTTGIAVGMACSFPSHNMHGAINSILHYIDNEKATTEELLNILEGPDFPTGGIIINRSELLDGYKTGRGRIRVRGKYHIEKKGKKEIIVFTEIPYMVKKEKLITDIVESCKLKEIEGISDVHDESDSEMRFVIEVATGYDPESVVASLFSKSQLEDTFSLNFTCLINGEPRTVSYNELVSNYVNFQRDVIIKSTEYDLNKIKVRLNIVDGLVIALNNIDKVIAIIKGSPSTKEAKDSLIKTFSLNEEQAKAILSMRLSKLTKLEVNDLKEEKVSLEKEKLKLENILNTPKEVDNILIIDLKNIATLYGDSRRTLIDQIYIEKTKKEKAEKLALPVTISLDSNFNIKAIDQKNAKTSASIAYTVKTDTCSSISFFGSDGKVYKVLVEDLTIGANLIKLLSLKDITIVSLLQENKNKNVILLTKDGYIKKGYLSEYLDIKRSGTIGIKLHDNDKLVKVLSLEDEQIIIFSRNGNSIRIETKDISVTSRNSIGIYGMKLKDNDELSAATVINSNAKYIASFSRKGQAKKTELNEFPLQNRNGIGTIGHKLIPSDSIIEVIALNDKDSILTFDESKNKIFTTDDLPTVGRATMGNMLIKTETLLSVIKIT